MSKRHFNLITDFVESQRIAREAQVKTLQKTTSQQRHKPYTTYEDTKEVNIIILFLDR